MKSMSWDETLAKLPLERQQRITARTTEIVAEHAGLRELRRARRLSQAALAGRLGTDQAGVSKLEKRADLLLSTLKEFVEAAGGELEIIARFPDSPPLRLDGIGVPRVRPTVD
jgi:DNA-binding transcriptional regulator YiaG